VRVNSRLAVRDYDCADGVAIKLKRSSGADDSVNVTEFAQAPQRRHQQSLADAAAAFTLRDAGWPKERFARALVRGEPNHPDVARGNENGDWFVREAD